ncbi:YeiH family protein [Bacillus sp. Marseille-P3800]|uniref:YeiH family protein n=1 Tax=Bacillus sp. Marseille-P3800 TaxID=2014782 RepID=UPI000C0691DD|nr:putative sulfate exporter family transporter [Bacillus sp. Marseille-P3800]
MNKHMLMGIGLTAFLALIAVGLGRLPGFTLVGPLIIAMLLGMLIGNWTNLDKGLDKRITCSTKIFLRLGIVLLGLRLNLVDIQALGWNGFLYAGTLTIVAFFSVYFISRKLKIDHTLSLLIASGTAICGAAAIAAVAPVVQAKDRVVALAIATIALVGTFFTLIYTGLFPLIQPNPETYGIFAGGTLHEIAHVVAASSIGGEEAENHAIIIKMLRVMLLIPVVFILLFVYEHKKNAGRPSVSLKTLPIPYFIVGFLAMSLIQTFSLLPESLVSILIDLAYFLLAMAMAGLGMKVKFHSFKEVGSRLLFAGLGGSIILVLAGWLLVGVIF